MKSLSNKRHKHQGIQTGVFAPFVPGASLISGWNGGSSVHSSVDNLAVSTKTSLSFAFIRDTIERSPVLFAFAASTTSRITDKQTENPSSPARVGWIPLPGSQSNPVSCQYILPFPEYRTVLWANPGFWKYSSRPWDIGAFCWQVIERG